MRRIPVIFLLALATGPFSAQAIFMPSENDLPTISVEKAVFGLRGDYEELKKIMLTILKSYPSSQYVYVTVGRSPTPLAALMKAVLAEDIEINLPLKAAGALRWRGQSSWEGLRKTYEEVSQSLQPHLAHFLPRAADLSGKRILLIDFASTGKSLVETYRQVQRFYGDAVPVAALGLAYDNQELVHRFAKELGEADIPYILLSNRLSERLIAREYREYSEYEPYRVDTYHYRGRYTPPASRIQFHSLKDAFRRRAHVDTGLRQALQSLFPEALLLQQTPATWRDRLDCWKHLLAR